MSVLQEISRRKITEILHFTTNRGVVGVLATSFLKSRFRLPQDDYLQYVMHVNATNRPEATGFFDKSKNWLDFVNLSVTEINHRYFKVSQGWHKDSSVWWAILSFDASITAHEGVVFTTTNNSYVDLCRRAPEVDGLCALFEPRIQRKHGWTVSRNGRADNLPTCEQAEVLYPEQVSSTYLKKIYVSCAEHHDLIVGWLREYERLDVNVLIEPNKFLGKTN